MDELQKKYVELILTYPNKDLENNIKGDDNYQLLSKEIKKELLKNIDKNHLNEIRSALAMNIDIKNESNNNIYNYIDEYINKYDITDPIIMYIFDNWDKSSEKWNKSTLVYDLV
jgi:hypothetical protein